MCNPIFFLFAFLRSWFQSRLRLQAEIVALRDQVIVLRRSQKGRVHLRAADRLFWVWLTRLWSGWRSALIIVKPETVLSWHRKGFRWYWTWIPPAPERTDIYDKLGRVLKLLAGKLAGLADLQRKQELKKKIQCPPVPLFREVRELLLEKCKRDKRRQVRAIVEKEAFGDLNA